MFYMELFWLAQILSPDGATPMQKKKCQETFAYLCNHLYKQIMKITN